MFAKLVLVPALATLVFAVPTLSRAETNAEWLLRQLQATDGYDPMPAQAGPRHDQAYKQNPFEGTSLKDRHEQPAARSDKSGGFRFRDGRVFLPNGQEISAP